MKYLLKVIIILNLMFSTHPSQAAYFGETCFTPKSLVGGDGCRSKIISYIDMVGENGFVIALWNHLWTGSSTDPKALNQVIKRIASSGIPILILYQSGNLEGGAQPFFKDHFNGENALALPITLDEYEHFHHKALLAQIKEGGKPTFLVSTGSFHPTSNAENKSSENAVFIKSNEPNLLREYLEYIQGFLGNRVQITDTDTQEINFL